MIYGRLKSLGIENEAFSSLILEKTKQHIEENFPEMFAIHCIPKKYQKGIISIKCIRPEVRYYMDQYKSVLLTLLQKDFPQEPFTRLIFLS